MTITFYATNKRLNSIIQPDVDESQTATTTLTDFYLKEQTDMNHPVFIVTSGIIPEVNYCILYGTNPDYRPDKYYYWIDRVEQYRKNVWHIHCTIDALATWKNLIRNQAAFVVRSSNLGSKWIQDNNLAVLSNTSISRVFSYINTDLENGTRNGSYIVRVASNSTGSNVMGAIGTYAFTPQTAARFFRALYSPDTLTNVKNAFGDIASAIVDCYWLPIPLTKIIGSPVDSINLGGTPILVSNCYEVTGSFYINTYNITATLVNYNDFRSAPPYVSYEAKMPWVGTVKLDTNGICLQVRNGGASQTLSVTTRIDLISGVIQFAFYCGSRPVGRFEACAKVDIPIAAFKPNLAGIVSGKAASSGSTLFGGGFQKPRGSNDRWYTAHNVEAARGSINYAAKYLGDMSVNSGGASQIIGGYSGTMLGLTDPEIVIYQYVNVVSDSPDSIKSTIGLPVNGAAALSNCTGYVQTDGFSVRGRMTAEEKQMIESAFNDTGVFMTE